MIEAAERTQQTGKTGAQKQETTASLAADTLLDATKEGAKGFVNGLMQQEIGRPVFSSEKPERIPFPVNQERAATRPNTESTPSPLAAPVSKLERKDRRESQARINKIRQELKQTPR